MMLVRMPNTRSGIIVRIERVATTKIDAKKVLAAPACSARCEVSIGSPPILRSERLRDQSPVRAPHGNARGARFGYTGKNVFAGFLAHPSQRYSLPRPCSAGQHKPVGASRRRADEFAPPAG